MRTKTGFYGDPEWGVGAWMERGRYKCGKATLHRVRAQIRATQKGEHQRMTYQRLRKIRRHLYRDRRTAQHGFWEPNESKSSAEKVPWHRVSEKGWSKEGTHWERQQWWQPNARCWNTSCSEEDICEGVGTTEPGYIRRMNKQVKILRMRTSLLSEKGDNKFCKKKLERVAIISNNSWLPVESDTEL